MEHKWACAQYRGKIIYTGHWPKHDGKIMTMVRLLKANGWCFPPIPVVDMGCYFQALDGSHRTAACKQLNRDPEIAIVDARLHPKQEIPETWIEIVRAPLIHDRTIVGYGLIGSERENHIGVVLDDTRELLPVAYVEHLFNLLLTLTRKVRVINKKASK